MPVRPIPEGFTTVTPHLVVSGAEKAIEFYKKAFGAEELFRMPIPGGKGVAHAEIQIGNSRLMLADAMGPMCRSPKDLGGSPVSIHLYVEDADAVYTRAVKAGATATMPIMDAFWGDRYGKVTDPFGHEWSIATHKKDLTPEQIGQAAAAAFGSGDCGPGAKKK